MERPEGSNEMPPGVKPMDDQPTSSSSKPTPPASSSSSSQPKPKEPVPAAEEEEDVKMEDDGDAKAKQEAEELKAKGTVAYKARKFEEAEEMYQKAWDTWPKDVTYLTNLSGKLSQTLLL